MLSESEAVVTMREERTDGFEDFRAMEDFNNISSRNNFNQMGSEFFDTEKRLLWLTQSKK